MGIIRRRIIPDSCSDFTVHKALSCLVTLSLPDFPEVGLMKPGLRGGQEEAPGLQLQMVALGLGASK